MLESQLPEPRLPRDENFVIGDWQVQPACNRIIHRQRGVERKLEPRLMHLLCIVAANPGRTLSRNELVAELWPRVIVTENSLTRAISELRKHLASAGGCRSRIETVPKKGYRLVVEEAARGSLRRGAQAWPAVALSVLAAAVLAGSWLTERGAAPVSPYPIDAGIAEFGQEFVPVSSDKGGLAGVRREAPVLSADGSRFAFIRHDEAGSAIWLGDLRGGNEPVAVYRSSLPLANLTWSPAGNALLFARQGAVAAEALYGGVRPTQLMQIDLTNWTISTLVEEPEQAEQPMPVEIDLT